MKAMWFRSYFVIKKSLEYRDLAISKCLVVLSKFDGFPINNVTSIYECYREMRAYIRLSQEAREFFSTPSITP